MNDDQLQTVWLTGEVLAQGVAQGELWFLPGGEHTPFETDPDATAGEPPDEADRFTAGVDELADDLRHTMRRLDADALSAEAGIVRAHLTMLQDPELHRQVRQAIERTRLAAEHAVEHVIEDMIGLFAEMDNPLLAERSSDLRDLAQQLRAKLTRDDGAAISDFVRDHPAPVLVVPELLPSLVLQAQQYGVAGFVVDRGTAVGHGAILARSFAMPAIRVSSIDSLRMREGLTVLVDGDAGQIVVNPGADAPSRVSQSTVTIESDVSNADDMEPGDAPDVRVWLSIADPEQLAGVEWDDLAGVGLYRTEYLFMGQRRDFPTETEQLAVYTRLFELSDDRPVTVRTADLGGDKPVSYMAFGSQENPNLGLRAHRLYKFHPDLLTTQLRALLKAAADHPKLRILYPMIESIEQWRFVQELTQQTVESLREENARFQEHFECGPLIETPSAALSFRRLLNEADFASIGTNDLVQYLFAVDRGATDVAELYQPEHPVVLEVLHDLAAQAMEVGKPLTVCGEVAADARRLPILVGLGIRDISVPVPLAGSIRARIDGLRAESCRRLAEQGITADSVQQVRTWLGLAETDAHSEGAKEAVDPVCGMTVDPAKTPFLLEHGGATHYFCSPRCRDQFVQWRSDAGDTGNRI